MITCLPCGRSLDVGERVVPVYAVRPNTWSAPFPHPENVATEWRHVGCVHPAAVTK